MLDKLLRSAHNAMSSDSSDPQAATPLLEPTPITLSVPHNTTPSLRVGSASPSTQHSPSSSLNLSVPFTPNTATSNPPSPMLTMSSDMRGTEYELSRWNFADYMRMHSHAQNQNVAISGPGVIVPAVTPLYIVPSSHAEPQLSSVSPYGGSHLDGVYALPYPVSPQSGADIRPHHSAEYNHHHQLASPTIGEVGNVSWEQFMSSMGL